MNLPERGMVKIADNELRSSSSTSKKAFVVAFWGESESPGKPHMALR